MSDNQLQVFSYEGNEIRTVQKDDKVLWVLKDVCRILGIEMADGTMYQNKLLLIAGGLSSKRVKTKRRDMSV